MELFIKGEFVNLRPIGKDNLSLINLWYRQVNTFGYATGGKNPEDILREKENPRRVPSFISGIYPVHQENCIGLIAGEMKNIREPVLWIKTFLVDTGWQRKRYGTHAFQLLLDYASRNFRIRRVYVSVSEENKQGIAFWNSLGFSCVRALKTEESYSMNILILEKVIRP